VVQAVAVQDDLLHLVVRLHHLVKEVLVVAQMVLLEIILVVVVVAHQVRELLVVIKLAISQAVVMEQHQPLQAHQSHTLVAVEVVVTELALLLFLRVAQAVVGLVAIHLT
jgi:hypothetical protein